MSDSLMPLLAALPGAEPDAARTARTKARCHARLERAMRRVEARQAALDRVRGRYQAIWPTVIAALSVMYLADAIALALGLYVGK